jgi:hypothetical protein
VPEYRKTGPRGSSLLPERVVADRAEAKFDQYCKWAGFNDRVVFRCGAQDPKTGNQIPVTRGLNDWREQGFIEEELHGLKEDFELFKKTTLQGKSDKSALSAVKPLPFH